MISRQMARLSGASFVFKGLAIFYFPYYIKARSLFSGGFLYSLMMHRNWCAPHYSRIKDSLVIWRALIALSGVQYINLMVIYEACPSKWRGFLYS
jgi:hypothetical protein